MTLGAKNAIYESLGGQKRNCEKLGSKVVILKCFGLRDLI